MGLRDALAHIAQGPLRGGGQFLNAGRNLRNTLGETFYPTQLDAMGNRVNAGTAMDFGGLKGLFRVPMTREEFFGIERSREPFIHMPHQGLTIMPEGGRGTRALLGEDEDAFAHADLAASFLDYLKAKEIPYDKNIVIPYGVNPSEVELGRREGGRVASHGEMLNLWPRDRSGSIIKSQAPVMGEVRYPMPMNQAYYDTPTDMQSTRFRDLKAQLEHRMMNPTISIFEHERDTPDSLLTMLAGKFPDRRGNIYTDDGQVPGPIMRQHAARARREGMEPDQFHADLTMQLAAHREREAEMAERAMARRTKRRVKGEKNPAPKNQNLNTAAAYEQVHDRPSTPSWQPPLPKKLIARVGSPKPAGQRQKRSGR